MRYTLFLSELVGCLIFYFVFFSTIKTTKDYSMISIVLWLAVDKGSEMNLFLFYLNSTDFQNFPD